MIVVTPWQARRRKRIFMRWGPLLLISAAAFLIALLVSRHIERTSSLEERFWRAWENDDDEIAEGAAWQMVRTHVDDVRWWIWFIDAHTTVLDESEGDDPSVSSVGERAVRDQLAHVRDAHTATVASYWYEQEMKPGDADTSAVTTLANATPPARFANYVLARLAMQKKDWRTAASRFEREGLAFGDGRERSLRRAMRLWVSHDEWREVRRRINDPHYAHVVDAALRLELALHDRDWLRVLLWCWPASYVYVSAWPIALALIAAVLWFWIATRLGRIQDGERGRATLYAASFVLGVLSIYPTLLTANIEELFGLQELGRAVPDLIYYIFGVGLREEAWKIICFLPLVRPLLRRRSRIEAMTCGALVGLGFAAEENISYFVDGADAAVERFLTANFLHISLTALVALSVFDTLRKRATSQDAFNVVFPMAVTIHGAYDFFLSTDDIPLSSIISIALLIVMAQRFLRQLLIASSREEERDVLNLLIASMATITGAAYVYATTLVGPMAAFKLIAIGTLSVAVVIFMFVRELGSA